MWRLKSLTNTMLKHMLVVSDAISILHIRDQLLLSLLSVLFLLVLFYSFTPILNHLYLDLLSPLLTYCYDYEDEKAR